ncbi:hypothetical protein KBTX_04533 [wastewater metagenome]|uniref:Uncharacterized protein n=2 Tax=unclassified sequences TaxID=12908 RepID=A0A5B8RKE7_9ZZZZ|nr:hypothetical protein KBTEX_04533 [uncultured organism]
MGISGTSEPERMTSPAFSGMPKAPRVFASQATQFTGEPRAAAPAPVLTTSPFFSTTMPAVTRSTSRGSTILSPSTNSPQEALSATVSWIRMRQSRMRESTISKHGMT